MPRGLFAQCATVLFEAPPTLAQLEQALAAIDARPFRREAASEQASWVGHNDELALAYAPEGRPRGQILVDVLRAPYPDSMGDPEEDAELFGAWTLAAFGPAAFPGNLARAVQHAVHWPEGARDAAERHGAFVRFRLSYALGKGPDAPVYPEGADPIHELVLLALLGQATLDLPGALAFFQPGAELLLSQRDVRERLGRARKQELPPVDVFAHARFVHVSDAPGWSLMDTVGLDALFLPDQEACFRPEAISLDAVHGFLLDLACYLVQEGEVVKPGDTVEGPGGVWRCHAAPENALRPAPRRTLRWFPEGEDVPAVFRVE